MTGWLNVEDLDDLLTYWPGADTIEPTELALLLASAQAQCSAFAPAVEADEVPENYRHAQTLQAMALHRATLAGVNSSIGMDGQAVAVFPMDWTVKLLLRPKTGRPKVG